VHDLELSYRPLELRDHLDQLDRDPRSIDIPAVRWAAPGREVVLNVRLAPLRKDGEVIGTSVVYEDVTDRAALHAELTASKRKLQRAYEDLQATVEELETTNEELQSANEELERTNEELQAVNRELERTNGEVQAVNQELEMINEELRLREGSAG
jgi:two-component system CheB/CheR fusion protein